MKSTHSQTDTETLLHRAGNMKGPVMRRNIQSAVWTANGRGVAPSVAAAAVAVAVVVAVAVEVEDVDGNTATAAEVDRCVGQQQP